MTGSRRHSIDVILPFHREDKNLYSAMNSIVKSKSVDIHLILVDNCIEPAKEFQESLIGRFKNYEVTYLRSAEQGYAHALNLARPAVRSDFVAIMNSDDLSGRKRLIRSIRRIERTNSDVCLGRLIKFKGCLPLPSLAGSLKLKGFSPGLLVLGPFGADAAVVVRSEFWLKYMNYPEELQPADWIVALRTYGGARITTEPRARYYYRIHTDQTTSVESNQPLDGLFNEITKFTISENLPLPPKGLQYQISTSWLNFDPAQFRLKDYQEWETLFLNSIQIKRHHREAKRILQRKRCIFRLRGVSIAVNPLIFPGILFNVFILRFSKAFRG
jgi:glycosyltransferase involved in cell wall biosynthesis